MVSLNTLSDGSEGRLKRCGMRETVRQAYRMLKLDGTLFDIHDDVDGAKQAF